MEIRLDGRVALVTGASKGIGKAIAEMFATNGASVMMTARKEEGLLSASAEIDGETAVHVANAGSPDDAARCIDATLEKFGRIDILVNNAATNPYQGPTIGADLPRFDKTVSVNLRGPFVWTQLAWERWMQAHGGSVINIVSVGGLTHGGSIGIYDTTKAGLIHLTKQLATEMGPSVRVNAIAPGLVKTDFARALWENKEDAGGEWPLGRLGTPHDIAAAAFFLASEELSGWVTGSVLVVDGGESLANTSASD